MAATSRPAPPRQSSASSLHATRVASIALLRRAIRDARVRTLAFAYLFALYAFVEAAGYRSAYPTLADRIAFAHSFAGNAAVRLFYGYPYDPLTVAGYSAWRVGGTLAIVAAVFGVLAGVRALRTEEDTGRSEVVLAGIVGRRGAYVSALGAVAICVLILWVAETLGFLAGGLPVGGSAYLALATCSVAAVFAGVGALASQLAPARRTALEIGSAAVALFWLLRVVADTASGAGWVRWLTPLGWAELLRPFSGTEPGVLVLPVLAAALLVALAGRIAVGRDLGTGIIATRDSSKPRLRLLSSPSAHALRSELSSLAVWLGSLCAFALILGVVSSSVSNAGISKNIEREAAKFGAGSILTPKGYLSFIFIFFVLAVSLFACAQVGAARQEEAEERLETMLALPIGRHRWLGGRLLLAAAAAAVLSFAAGLFTWAGAASQGVAISLPQMLEAGANCMPVALLFLGLAALAYAALPRASAGIAYGLVTVAFLWELIGSLLSVPKWVVELTPFSQVGLVPVDSFKTVAALVMLGVGVLAALAAMALFRRRDLMGR